MGLCRALLAVAFVLVICDNAVSALKCYEGASSTLEGLPENCPEPLKTPFTNASEGIDYARKRQECLEKKIPFVDPDFPTQWRSFSDMISYSDSLNIKPVQHLYNLEWKRPKELAEKPVFISDGPSRFDTQQGSVNNCWFVAAIAALANDEELFKQVVDTTQNFDDDAGIFHFKFWYYGKWVDVVIDDRLPCSTTEVDEDGKPIYKPIFMNILDDEFWPALMEKAYAKLYSSYARTNYGLPNEAFVDFTGGISALVDTSNDEVFKNYLTLIAQKKCYGWTEFKVVPEKLITNHAYVIIDYRQVKNIGGQQVCLIKLYNPHGAGNDGNSNEFNGEWSDGSKKWDELNRSDRENLLEKKENGEFWMSFEYLKDNNLRCGVTAYSSENIYKILNSAEMKVPSPIRSKWNFAQANGRWIKREDSKITALTPELDADRQFMLTLSDSDNVDDSTLKKEHTVIMSVLEKYERENKVEARKRIFSVYKLNADNKPETAMKIKFDTVGTREVTSMFQAVPGKYLVVVELGTNNLEDFLIKEAIGQDIRGEFLLRARSTGNIVLTKKQDFVA